VDRGEHAQQVQVELAEVHRGPPGSP
jgi:hypothetical protein